MPIETIDVRASADPSAAVERAALALRRGGLVVLPTETVYGVAASAADPKAMDRLWRLKGEERRAPLAWHFHSSAALTTAILAAPMDATPIHRRLIRILTPGPVTFAFNAGPDRLSAIRDHVGVAPAVFDDGKELLARVPDRRVARDVIERAEVPIVIASLGEPRLARTAEDAADAIHGIDDSLLLLNDGPATFSKQSTLIRLAPEGGYEVVREGAIDARTIRKRMARTLLFVCTGNTCRSPMAAAIARHLLAAAKNTGIETRVKSAGTSAGFGMDATPEGAEALRELGIEMGRHSSAPLSRELLNEAEAVFAMTRSHIEAILRLDPSAAGRVLLLDPAGGDIADPIGSPRAVYDETARTLREAIERRLRELPE